ncbi:MAG: hypothetical protein V4462_00620 [Pseudomonadota bacterium]
MSELQRDLIRDLAVEHLFKSVIEGVLSVPADRHRGAGAMAELAGRFVRPGMLKPPMPSKSDADAYPSPPAASRLANPLPLQ